MERNARKFLRDEKPRFNLQLFAGEGEGGEGTKGGEGGEGEGTKGAKTFTQEEVNNFVSGSVKKETEKLLKELGFTDFTTAKEGTTKYKEWLATQMSELDLTKKERDELKAKMEGYDSQLKTATIGAKIVESGIKPEYKDKVLKLIAGEEDIDKAIKSILEEFPMFKGSVQSDKGGKSGGKAGGTGKEAEIQAMRKRMGLK